MEALLEGLKEDSPIEALVEKLDGNPVDFCYQNQNGQTVLMVAIEEKKLLQMSPLLLVSADNRVKKMNLAKSFLSFDVNRKSVLFYAIESDDLKTFHLIFNLLMKYQAEGMISFDINHRNNNKETAIDVCLLLSTFTLKKLKMLEKLLELQPDLSTPDLGIITYRRSEDGFWIWSHSSGLYQNYLVDLLYALSCLAASEKANELVALSVSIATKFVEYGADVFFVATNQGNLLHACVHTAQPVILKYLLSLYNDFDKNTIGYSTLKEKRERKRTGSQQQRQQLPSKLYEMLQTRDSDGATALLRCVENYFNTNHLLSRVECVKLLVEFGAPIKGMLLRCVQLMSRSLTPLKAYSDIAIYFIDQGADIRVTDSRGCNLLYFILKCFAVDVLKKLLETHFSKPEGEVAVDPMLCNSIVLANRVPLDYLCDRRYASEHLRYDIQPSLDMIELLVAYGSPYQTALYHCVLNFEFGSTKHFLKTFLKHKQVVDVNSSAKTRMKFIMVAILENKYQYCKALFSAGADLKLPFLSSICRHEPPHRTVRYEHLEMLVRDHDLDSSKNFVCHLCMQIIPRRNKQVSTCMDSLSCACRICEDCYFFKGFKEKKLLSASKKPCDAFGLTVTNLAKRKGNPVIISWSIAITRHEPLVQLRDKELSEYIQIFVNAGLYDAKVLSHLSQAKLELLGIRKKQHQEQLLSALKL